MPPKSNVTMNQLIKIAFGYLDLNLDLDLDFKSIDLKCLDSKSIDFKISYLVLFYTKEDLKFKILKSRLRLDIWIWIWILNF